MPKSLVKKLGQQRRADFKSLESAALFLKLEIDFQSLISLNLLHSTICWQFY